LFFVLSVFSHTRVRKMVSIFLGVSTTLLATFWLGIDSTGLSAALGPELQLLVAALAIALAAWPLAAFWVDNRIATLPLEELEAARVLGCPPARIAWHLFWPRARDIGARVAVMVGVAALGELAFTSLFVSRTDLLATLARRMALRYDFSGGTWILLLMSGATLVFLSIEWIYRATQQKTT
jgi:ABC-type glycerol-3-phosphate transport system permease component